MVGMGTPGGVGRAFLHDSMDGMGTRGRAGRASLRFSIVGIVDSYVWEYFLFQMLLTT